MNRRQADIGYWIGVLVMLAVGILLWATGDGCVWE